MVMLGPSMFTSTEGEGLVRELSESVFTQRERVAAELGHLVRVVDASGGVLPVMPVPELRERFLRGSAAAAVVHDRVVREARYTRGVLNRWGGQAFFLPGISVSDDLLGLAASAARASVVVRDCLWERGDRGIMHPSRLVVFDRLARDLSGIRDERLAARAVR